ncbi:hypothetical protein B0H19DRAFT_1190569 [Mycena capillaripes]|nr:hypothetical protein B0H19DRAFT_1190569 [Mycena capillaripes]
MTTSSSFKFALGPLSNREPQFQKQNTLVVDRYGRLRYAALSRRALALPLEILAEIFMHSLPNADFVTPNLTAAPLVLCGVCNQWREVAISTPKLWSSLVFDVQLATGAAYVDLYKTWLSRARKTPLSLSLQDREGQNPPDSVRPLLQTIAGLSPQWRNMDVDLGKDLAEFLFPSEGSVKGEFPLLEKLAIGYAIPLGPLPISFSNAPKLREVFASTYPTVPPMQFPFAQITAFQTYHITLSSCLEILTNAPNLIDGTFEIENRNASTVSPSVISLDHLESLALAGMLVNEADILPMTLLECLKTPALKNLTLQFVYLYGSHTWSHSWSVTPFLSFLSRSSIQLQSLALSLMLTTTESLIQCLKAIRSLVDLKLEPLRVVDMDVIFTKLTGDSDFLPKLESVHLFFSIHTGIHYINPTVVAGMLSWRWATDGITRLRSFQMAQSLYRPHFREKEEAESEFRRLKEEGMDLYLGLARPDIDSFRTNTAFNRS